MRTPTTALSLLAALFILVSAAACSGPTPQAPSPPPSPTPGPPVPPWELHTVTLDARVPFRDPGSGSRALTSVQAAGDALFYAGLDGVIRLSPWHPPAEPQVIVPGPHAQAAISADGRWLAAVPVSCRWELEPQPCLAWRVDALDLWRLDGEPARVARVEGDDLRAAVGITPDNEYEDLPDARYPVWNLEVREARWAPDGRHVALLLARQSMDMGETGATTLVVVDRTGRLAVVGPERGWRRELGSHGDIRWVDDGRLLWLQRETPDVTVDMTYTLVVSDLQGRSSIEATFTAEHWADYQVPRILAWSPASGLLVAAIPDADGRATWFRVTGDGVQWLGPGPGAGFSLWIDTPEGSLLEWAFAAARWGGRPAVTAWSPDGTKRIEIHDDAYARAGLEHWFVRPGTGIGSGWSVDAPPGKEAVHQASLHVLTWRPEP